MGGFVKGNGDKQTTKSAKRKENVWTSAGHRGDVPDEEAREVDHVGTEVTQRPRPGRRGWNRHVSSVGSSPESWR